MIRQAWGQTDAFVTTDCGAVSNMLGQLEPAPGHTRLAAIPEEAAAWTINNGTDLEMGSTIWTTHMMNATKMGLVSEATIARSVRRGLRQQFLAGRFSPGKAWAELGAKDINSTRAQLIQNEAALQGMILLKNEGLLPLKQGSNIAVVGPMGVDTLLTSDYAGGTGEGGCWPKADASCVRTIFEAIREANVGGTTHSAPGVPAAHDHSPPAKFLADAITVAKGADIVVLAVGNDRNAEHEGIDRPDVNLTSAQQALATQVLALGKPTLLLLSNGGAVSIDGLIEGSKSIVECFNPAHNTPQLAKLLFGENNNWGKLPVTIYSHNYTTGGDGLPAQPMQNYDMVSSPVRADRAPAPLLVLCAVCKKAQARCCGGRGARTDITRARRCSRSGPASA